MTGDDEVFGLKLTDFKPAADEPADHRVHLLTGPSWFVYRDGDVLMLSYLSGEHGGGARAIAIDDTDLTRLKDEPGAVDAVLIRHHAS